MRRESVIFLTCIALLPAARVASGDTLAVTDKLFHLGDSPKPEWKDRTTVEPTGRRSLEIEFESVENPGQLTLEIQSGGVGQDWKVMLNGKEIGVLKKAETLTTQFLAIPPSTLKKGRNKLSVVTTAASDDIYVGKATIRDRPLRELQGLVPVKVSVKDAATSENLPCRLTVTRRSSRTSQEELVDLSETSGKGTAVRKGILYTQDGLASFELPPDSYTLYATRGFEYGLATVTLNLKRGEKAQSFALTLRREVDTTGFLAADTHLHTRTNSGHGDINVPERMVTVAGEGVEIAIATDHNHNTDYGPDIEKARLEEEFQSIIGNEVTTSIGHFKAFPFEKGAKAPRSDLKDWVRLIEGIRAGPGVRVVILNHPRRAISKLNALEMIRLNPLSGEAEYGPENLGLDAIEVLNGKTLSADPMETFRDWFGLLNRGYHMKAVAGSDSHAVAEIIGQARTYVAASTDDPRKASVESICKNILAGKLLVSLGLLAEVKVNGKYTVGDLATGLDSSLDAEITVQGPSWTRAEHVALYLNGIEIRKEQIEASDAPVKFSAIWRIPVPSHDAHLIVVAWGPPVTAPYWPVSGGGKRYVLGATNPIWIDGDRDGAFTSAYEYAKLLVKKHGLEGKELMNALAGYDSPVTVQVASLARAAAQREAQEAYERLMAEADKKVARFAEAADGVVKKALEAYSAASLKLDVRTRREKEEAARP